jgi:ABC-type phosphate/phosphonate transport system substrate-binding protein
MRALKATAAVALAALTITATAQSQSPSAAPRTADRLKMSISSALFNGMPETLVIALMKPFESLLIAQTGMGGDILPAGDGEAIAKQLMEGKIQVGVVEGIEYAWLKQKYPQLRPMMITINTDLYPHACVVVRKGGGIAKLADLKDKVLAEIKDSREYCRLFRDRLCAQAAQAAAKEFFFKINPCQDGEAALDDVVDHQAHAAVLDKICFENYKRRKPTRGEQLEVIEVSEPFPASVVIYKDGSLDGTKLQKFQQGMLKANKTVLGRKLLTLWKLTAFVPVPRDYEEHAAKIIQTYPAPDREQMSRH